MKKGMFWFLKLIYGLDVYILYVVLGSVIDKVLLFGELLDCLVVYVKYFDLC